MLAGFPAGLLPADPTQDNHHLHQSGLVVDPNSPETFKQNILLVRDNVTRLQNLANSALIGIQNAYNPGSNPMHTTAELANLKQSLELLCDLMRQTGVGALPLLSGDQNKVPMSDSMLNENELLESTTRSVEEVFERVKKQQETALNIGNLLGSART
ncbi:hypothetical protein BDV98DRAFT_512526 [Pterulicium gracile]|uniref:Uncharacterized protein n=1 Tax=Pterulicium gracile TaxID=1884261 RepID=A0A5C3Q8S4_9AGAR|nr:hypothetical protein BDV98DRAFT_512526 [Pterula gracilis]